MNSFTNRLRVLLSVCTLFIVTTTSTNWVFAQSLPVVPSELTFADLSIYLSEAARSQVQQEIRLLYANRKRLEEDMDALRELTPFWQPTLQDASLPLDFRYVALPFNGTTNSVYWSVQTQQLTTIGLRVDEVVDESRHPLIAMEKVSAYMKQLRGKYQENAVTLLLRYLRNDQLTASESPVKTQVESVWLDVNSPPLLWKILARKIMVEQQVPTYRPALMYSVYVYELGADKTLPAIARQLNVPDNRLQPYNGWLKVAVVPINPVYPVLVRLKADEFPAVLAAGAGADRLVAVLPTTNVDLGFPVLLKSPVQEDGLRAPATFYTINERRGVQAQSCDNPITLAFYGGISPAKFLDYNDLTEQDVVRPGQIYYLERKAKRAKIPFHLVQRNQSLRDVANMYGMRLSSLLRFNRIETTKRAGPGRILWLQKKRPRNRPVEYQQLPPQSAPVLPLPQPALAVADSVASPDPVEPTKGLTITPPTISEQTPVATNTETAPTPVNVPKPISPTPLTDDKVAVIEEPDPTTPDVEPATASAPSQPKKATEKVETIATIHVVKPGQTYYGISQLYKVTPEQLYEWNNLAARIPLEIGQELIVSPVRKPVGAGRPATVTIAPGQSSGGIINKFTIERPKPVVYHVVQPGQTVYRIALINKTTVANIMKWNKLQDYTIEVGEKLIVRNPY